VQQEQPYPRAYQPQHHQSSQDIMVTTNPHQPRQPMTTTRIHNTEAPYQRQSNEPPAPSTYSHNNTFQTEPQLRTPHVELPSFHSDNVRTWILEVEDIFKLVGITGESRVKWGIAHIRGPAKIWLSSSGIDLQHVTWAELCQFLIA
jgi:hypothetical protein